MRKKNLAILLSKLEDYEGKKPGLEQYTTPSSTAATLLWKAYMSNDLKNKVVLDAGSGNGILGIGALILGARKVYFVDVDEKSLRIVKKNCEKLDLGNYEVVNSNIVHFNKEVDVAVMNPPFGVQSKGLDVMFFKHVNSISEKVYAVYKGKGLKVLQQELPDSSIEVLERTSLKLGKQFSYHTSELRDTHVILVKITNSE